MWEHAAASLRAGVPVALLCVVRSEGSSPGRQGFKLSVTATETVGSIGGGIMEHKLVELMRARLQTGPHAPEIRRQVHRAHSPTDRSGMICSGEQTVALLPLTPAALPLVTDLLQQLRRAAPGQLRISAGGLELLPPGPLPAADLNPAHWHYTEALGFRHHVTLVGGGHVSLALAQVLAALDFGLTVLDDRAELNTLLRNDYAHRRRVVRYEALAPEIEESPAHLVVMMTFGYRTDYVALQQLLNHRLGFLGVLGSQAKIAAMWQQLRAAGVPEATLARVQAPVGVAIHSRTPEEIAISIAAELIQARRSASLDEE